ncbi:MAG: phosphotransferase family protein [Salinisphaera sp.]|nr:phosphotransferase family protein [Salinisphaera sp.]
MDKHWVENELARFFAEEVDTGARVMDVEVADGHAGLTFLFALERGGAVEDYVLRLPPPGVKRHGNTDVYRQAPLLRALHAAGLPVPAVPWAHAGEDWFGLPFLIMERLPGRTLLAWDPDPAHERKPEVIQPLWLQAADALAAIHRFDWRTDLADWEATKPLADQIAFWQPIYERAPETAWAPAGARTQRLLVDSIPADPSIGLVHGDYQPGNVLYQDGRISGVIDWELSHIGAQTLDLGWLMMMADPAMQDASYRCIHPPTPTAIRCTYERALGHTVADAPWYQALAGYRFGAIACLNVKLHRKGQREDALWEKIAPSVPYLFGHAAHLLRERSPTRNRVQE